MAELLSQTANPTAATVVLAGGTVDWADPTNIYADDGADAVAGPINSSEITRQIRASAFGFTLPTHSIIRGVIASANCYAEDANRLKDYLVKLLYAGNVVGDSMADTDFWATATDTVKTWGTARTTPVALHTYMVNASTFGVAIQVTDFALAASTAHIDVVSLTVYYEEIRGGMSMGLTFGLAGQ